MSAVKPDSDAVPAPVPKNADPDVSPNVVSVTAVAIPSTSTVVGAPTLNVMSPVIRTALRTKSSSTPPPPLIEPVTSPREPTLKVSLPLPPARFSVSENVTSPPPVDRSAPPLIPLKVHTLSTPGPVSVSAPPLPSKTIGARIAPPEKSIVTLSAMSPPTIRSVPNVAGPKSGAPPSTTTVRSAPDMTTVTV